MKRIVFCLSLMCFLGSCVAGEFTPERNRLHNMGKSEICAKNPSRCIEGTSIDW